MANQTIPVEIVYALAAEQWLLAFDVAPGTTALQLLHLSGLLTSRPELQQESEHQFCLGVFSQILSSPQSYQLQPHDRVEVYRPLLNDPKTARRQRAASKSQD